MDKVSKKDLSVHQLKDNEISGSVIDSLNQQILFLERHVEDLRKEIIAQDLKTESATRQLYSVIKSFKDLFNVVKNFIVKENT